jgi:thiamine-monophosphate kinase
MLDISDGLLQDLGHVAKASKVAIDIDRSAFEVPPQMRDAAQALGVDPYHWVLAGGDDHALAATFPRDRTLPDGWREIGRVSEGTGVTVDGKAPKGPIGWDHFA